MQVNNSSANRDTAPKRRSYGNSFEYLQAIGGPRTVRFNNQRVEETTCYFHVVGHMSIIFLNFSSCSGSACTVSRMDNVRWLERIPYCDVEVCWAAKKKIRVVDITRARVVIASTVLFSASARVIFYSKVWKTISHRAS